MQPASIVLADDHPILREGLAAFFNERRELDIVGQCSDGIAAVEMIKALAPDFAIIDLQMPKLHGLEVIQKLRDANSPSKLLVLSISHDKKMVGWALRAGADGYLVKDGPVRHLFDAINHIRDGGVYVSPLTRFFGGFGDKWKPPGRCCSASVAPIVRNSSTVRQNLDPLLPTHRAVRALEQRPFCRRIPEDIIPAEMQEPYSMAANSLVRNAGPRWDEATRSPFLDALAAGGLTADAFRRWLAQDYLFAKELLAFQAILLAKAPRDCHKPLIEGLAALGREMEWFETHAARLQVNLDIPPHPTCRRYSDFLIRCVYTQPYPVLLAILFGVEASYLAAWSALLPSGPYAEFIERWSGADFVTYVAVLGGLGERHPHEAAQEHFNEVLVHEREFWKMSWEG